MPQPDLTRPYLILVEGPGDAAFFRHLITARTIMDEFDVRCPSDAQGVSGSGNSRFREALDGFALIPGYDGLKGILIVTDNDEDGRASFTNIQTQIRRTSAGHPVPSAPLNATNGTTPIVVMMIPWIGEVGNLETLCVTAAESAFPNEAACADQFQACAGVDAWPLSKRSKVKLRSIISAVHRRNPDTSLAFLWDDYPRLIPLQHPCFDRIADFLSGFGSVIRGP